MQLKFRPIATATVLAILCLILSFAHLERTEAASLPIEYDFSKIGLMYTIGVDQQPTDHLHHLRLLGAQKTLSPAVYGTAFISRIYSTLNAPARSFQFDVPENGLYTISLKGALSLGGGYADILLDTDEQQGGGIKLISDFDFYKHPEDSSYRTLDSADKFVLSEGSHTITFKVKGKSVGSGAINMLPNKLILTPAELSPNPAVFVKDTLLDVAVTLPMAGAHLMSIGNESYQLVPGIDYFLEDRTITLNHAYLQTLDYGTQQLTFAFDNGYESIWTVQIIESPPVTLELNFKHLSLTDPTTGWYLTKLNPTDYPRVAIKSYGIELGSSTRVPLRSFSFNIAQAGLYGIDFTGNLISRAAGMADIYLDTDINDAGGTKVVDSFDFADVNNGPLRTVTVQQAVYLSEGHHKFTFKLLRDGAGSTVGYIYPHSFMLTKLENAVSPTAVTFDIVQPQDIAFALDTHADVVLLGIKNGTELLQRDIDYSINNGIITVNKAYLLNQVLGELLLNFDFNSKNDPFAQITIIDSTPIAQPDIVYFNKNETDQSDIAIQIKSNGYTFQRIRKGMKSLIRDIDYSVSSHEIVLKKDYLRTLEVGTAQLDLDFIGINGPAIQVVVTDTSSKISPERVGFAKGSLMQSDISITLLPNGAVELTNIYNGNQALVRDVDYFQSGNTVLLKKQYVSTLAAGTAKLTFVMSDGSRPALLVYMVDAEPAIAEITTLSASAVADTITVEGTIDSGANQQITITVHDPNGQLDFISQTVSGENGQFLFTYTKSRHIQGTYTVIVGGEQVESPRETTFMYTYEIPISIGMMLDLLDEYRGGIYSNATYYVLKLNLVVMRHYEQQEAAGKLVKHMEAFKLLLGQLNTHQLISEQAYNALTTATNTLIGQWR
ncbi:Endoglucanase Z precursor [compost metagenome]